MSCSKVPHGSYTNAMQTLRSVRARARKRGRDLHGLPIRVYRCPACNAWHLTSVPERTTVTPHRRAA